MAENDQRFILDSGHIGGGSASQPIGPIQVIYDKVLPENGDSLISTVLLEGNLKNLEGFFILLEGNLKRLEGNFILLEGNFTCDIQRIGANFENFPRLT